MADTGKRKIIQRITMWLLPVIIIGGIYWPYLGFAVGGMMVLFLVLAMFRGRHWCGWFCPRGAFLEIAMSPLTTRRHIPALFRTTGFRWGVFVLLMFFMLLRVWYAGSDLERLGFVFVTMCILTTAVALPLAVIFHPRTWCVICPMGTLQGVLGGERTSIRVAESCVECGVCARQCPMGLNPAEYKATGVVPGSDCSKCGSCVVKCPKQALS
ncbi:MAG TPA: 4Fe-4S binding protein [bacterium]|nr:4Fe-4S binding protein [bacterium]